MKRLFLLLLVLLCAKAFGIETRRFRFAPDEKSIATAEIVASEIEAIADEVESRAQVHWRAPTEVRIAHSRDAFEHMTLDGSRPYAWQVALAWPQHNVLLVDAPTLFSERGKETLRHELVHVLLGQYGNDWPHWFHEGLAQTLTEGPFETENTRLLTAAAHSKNLFHFEDLRDSFPTLPTDARLAYVQSAAFISYLKKHHSAQSFSTLFELIREKRSFEESFGIAFHSSLRSEFEGFRESVARDYPLWPILLDGTFLWLAMPFLVAIAFFVRRYQVKRKRAQQALEEAAQEAAFRLAKALFEAKIKLQNDSIVVGQIAEVSSQTPTVH